MVAQESSTIHDAVAFQAITAQLQDGTTPGAVIGHPCLERLSQVVRSMESGDGRPSPLDLAVLVRQALRFRELQNEGANPPRLHVQTGAGWPESSHWNQVGIDARLEGEEFVVRANSWCPNWLPDADRIGADTAAASERRRRIQEDIPGDPFLEKFRGHESYLTRGQRSAVRAAFSTPPGGSLLVSLPTGDGKSFVFQLLADIGYGSRDGLPGVTLVITPTVALALDQQRAAELLNVTHHRSAYVGGMPAEDRKDMIKRIREGTQGLCIASPEAACGILRDSLMAAAAGGFLRTIVVDEAHLVDAWGANFRASFQVLSGLRKEMLEEAPEGDQPRTLLLSATLTDTTVATLRTLFPGNAANGAGFKLLSAPLLRPEIEYWVSKETTPAQRVRRVVEAVLHMPRPAIVYTTEVAHAEALYNTLSGLGFHRLALMTGKSSSAPREQIINDWRENRLDLVVGTSAFGLGVDNPHVRTVIHACIPETLDRFYQEVGRGGRDGCSSASIMIPVKQSGRNVRDDFDTARGLNQRRLLTVEVAHRRWEAMFGNQDRRFEGDLKFRLRVDGPPGFESDYIDMVGETNTEWNLRTLTLMANARMIELLGPESVAEPQEHTDDEADESESEIATKFQQYQRIKILEPAHLEISKWHEIVDVHREHMDQAYKENLKRMFQFMDGTHCAADTLAPVYQLSLSYDSEEFSSPEVAKACGGCPNCRYLGHRRETEPAKNANHPWPAASLQSSPASRLLDAANRVLIFYPDEIDLRARRRLIGSLGSLAVAGVRNIISLPGAPITAEEIQKQVPDIALFAANKLPPWSSLPPGPTMMFLPIGFKLTDRIVRTRDATDVHFIFVHHEVEDPEVPGILYRRRIKGPQFTDLNLFNSQVS